MTDLSEINGWDEGVNSAQSVYPQLSQLLYNVPLLIDPAKADVIHHVLQGYALGQPPAIDALGSFQTRGERKPYQMTETGIAVIGVNGSMVHRSFGLDALSGLTSYQRISRLLAAAADDNDVRGILLDVDSPGGSVSGLFELTRQIQAINADKPIWSIAYESMTSAAYAIGASTGRILAPETATIGSIGVVMMHLDRSAANKKAGRAYTPVFAGAHKVDGSSHAPLSEQAYNTYKGMVDQTYGIFVSQVTNARGLEEQAVRNTEAQIFMARDALAANLIDGVVESFGEAVDMLESELNRSSSSTTRAEARNTTEEVTMSDKDKKPDDKVITPADLDAARSEGIDEGINQERARCEGILGHEKAAANFAQASNAIKTGLSLEQATGVLGAMPEPAKLESTFFARKAVQNNPDVAAVVGDEDVMGEDAKAAHAASLVNPLKAVGGK